MLINNDNIGYVERLNILGAIVAVNLLEGKATLITDDETFHEVEIEEIVELREIGILVEKDDDNTLKQKYVYEADVLKVIETGQLYEVVVLDNGQIAMHTLDKKLNRIEDKQGIAFDKSKIGSLSGVVKLMGNAYQLRAEQVSYDFNIRVARKIENGEVTYFYVGNNKENESIDLIKVIYLGHQLIEEEDYSRETLTYEEYKELIDSGELKEVDPMQLANYVAGLTYQPTYAKGQFTIADLEDTEVKGRPDVDDEDKSDELFDEDDEEICDDCGEPVEDCDCELW
jgi:hypothetical protein